MLVLQLNGASIDKCFRLLKQDPDRMQCSVMGCGMEGSGLNGMVGNQLLQL